jgi:hypothetical protein
MNEMDSFKFLEKCVVLLKSNFHVFRNIENRDYEHPDDMYP